MNKREWITAILNGDKDVPVAQHWMGYFNSTSAKRFTPKECHYSNMWWYDVSDKFDPSAIGPNQLDKLIEFNNYTGRCFACLGKGANISFGHGGPGEFFVRIKEPLENGFIADFETGVLAKMQFKPHFYHSYGHPVKSIQDLDNLKLPDPSNSKRYEGFAADAKYLKSKGEYVVGSLNGFFSGMHYFFMDYQETLMSLITNPELIYALMERLGNWNLTAAEQLVKAGADSIAFCDDLGSKENLLLSPSHYRKFIKPWHKKLCKKVHKLRATVHLHCHGANQAILDDLVECGFDFINPFDPEENWDIEEVLKNYSRHFVVIGGFPTKFWYWPAIQQEQYLVKMAKLGQKYGRFIFMDSGGIPEDISKSDHDRILETSRNVRGVANIGDCV
jgi:uroporphyrinogen-III decarboxylase